MINFNWKIPETIIEDGILKSVKYQCVATDGDLAVETEGNWTMRGEYVIPEEFHEGIVAHWMDIDAMQDGKHLIKSRLQEQLEGLRNPPSTRPPWAVETFKVQL